MSAVERAKEEAKAKAAASARIFPEDDEALKAEFQNLRKRMLSLHAVKNWSAYHGLYDRYEQVGIELGRRLGEDGVRWMQEIEPGCLVWVMDGWAEKDPTGALQAVARADRPRPCSEETLMKLIEAQKDVAGMKAAVLEVPWHLFDGMVYHPSLDSGSDGPRANLPKVENLSEWIESGAALAMAEKGIQFRHFFHQWVKQDPEQAFAHWETWPDERPNAATTRLVEMLESASQDQALVARLRAVWEKMPAEEQGRVSEAYGIFHKSLPTAWADPDDAMTREFLFLAPKSPTPPSE